jgi:hypothetical protein
MKLLKIPFHEHPVEHFGLDPVVEASEPLTSIGSRLLETRSAQDAIGLKS